jgi:hypothetical protein
MSGPYERPPASIVCMSFDERFELGELLRDDGVRTFLVHHKTGLAHYKTGSVRDRAAGRELLAHFLDNWEETSQLLASLDRLREPERRRIVERGERGGTPYVVTDGLAGHPGFREWLAVSSHAVSRNDARPLDSAGAWKVIVPEPSPEPSIDEQFFSLFPTGERPQARPNEASRQVEPNLEQDEPGEFTRLFQAPSPKPPPAPLPPAPSPWSGHAAPYQSQWSGHAAPYQSSDERTEPGEVTRLFQAPSEPPLPPPKKPAGTG